MLTVKHINRDGTEKLLEAETVDVVRKGGLGEEGIFINHSKNFTENTGSTTFDHVIHFDNSPACSSDDVTPVVYVMNRFGATVATYKL